MRLLLIILLLVMPLDQVVAENYDSSKRVEYIIEECENAYNEYVLGSLYPVALALTIDGTNCNVNGGKTQTLAEEDTLRSCEEDYNQTCIIYTGGRTVIPNETTSEVQSTTGTSISITPMTADGLVPSGTIPSIGALLTLENSNTSIQRADGSILEVKQKAVITLNSDSINLIRGEVTATVDCNYEVNTALATITSCPTTKKGADSAKFTANYSQDGVDGTLTVSVETGTVDVVDRSGVTHTITAGNEKTITNRVPRTQWVLPIDEDKLYGGKDNFLIWTQFPDAASYQMEFNLPTPDFAENNVSVPQFTKQVVPLPVGSYAEFEGLALLTLPLPKGADGLVLELRIFAVDSDGKIIGESVSSDSTKATVAD